MGTEAWRVFAMVCNFEKKQKSPKNCEKPPLEGAPLKTWCVFLSVIIPICSFWVETLMWQDLFLFAVGEVIKYSNDWKSSGMDTQSHHLAASGSSSSRNGAGLSPIPEYDYEATTFNSSVASTTSEILASLNNSDLAFEWSMLCQDCTDCWSGNGKKL